MRSRCSDRFTQHRFKGKSQKVFHYHRRKSRTTFTLQGEVNKPRLFSPQCVNFSDFLLTLWTMQLWPTQRKFQSPISPENKNNMNSLSPPWHPGLSATVIIPSSLTSFPFWYLSPIGFSSKLCDPLNDPISCEGGPASCQTISLWGISVLFFPVQTKHPFIRMP